MTTMGVSRFRKDPFRSARARERALRFGMWLFIVTLAIIFLSTFIAALVVRAQLEQRGEWPTSIPALPWTTLVSTAILIVSSVTMHRAQRAAERHDGAAGTRLLTATFVLGAAFLLLQASAWWTWVQLVGDLWDASQPRRFALGGFYVLTGLHALHVLGGLLGLGWIACRGPRSAFGGDEVKSDSEAVYHASIVKLVAMYWHFLLLIWSGVYALLLMLQ